MRSGPTGGGWSPDRPPAPYRIGPLGHLRALLRGGALMALLTAGLSLLLALRLVERPLWRQHRPWTPWITVLVCRAALRLIGLRLSRDGRLMTRRGGLVANHASWLDIFVLNALGPLYFVAKDEVAGWPVIGWLARATGTLFIRRDRRDARLQRRLFEQRLRAGHRLLFFPEGTSTDGTLVLPFKSTLFAAYFNRGDGADSWIQPLSLRYRPPPGADLRFYGWWGEMAFLPHLLKVLSVPRQGAVHVVCHPPLRVADYPDRKALARACTQMVRAGLEQGGGG